MNSLPPPDSSVGNPGPVDEECSHREPETRCQIVPIHNHIGIRVASFMVRCYQRVFRPILGNRCRFLPSCSDYCLLALQKYGLFKGLLKTAGRICRCQPFCKGGVDYP